MNDDEARKFAAELREGTFEAKRMCAELDAISEARSRKLSPPGPPPEYRDPALAYDKGFKRGYQVGLDEGVKRTAATVWISVEDTLPASGDDVLFFESFGNGEGETYVGRRSNRGEWYVGNDEWPTKFTNPITRWARVLMPGEKT